VKLIDLGSFFAVDLDANEVPVHEVSNPGFIKTLPGHDMAPVARGVTYGNKYGDVATACLGKSLRTPRPPINGLVGMLAKIMTALASKTIGHPSIRTRREGLASGQRLG
jgi:hypothetical protein